MRLWPVPVDVFAYDWENEDVSVLLPYGATRHEVAAALSAVRLYVPRGAHHLVWGCDINPAEMKERSHVMATIFDAHGAPIVHLYSYAFDREPRSRRRVHA